jgi:hypothetical protein
MRAGRRSAIGAGRILSHAFGAEFQGFIAFEISVITQKSVAAGMTALDGGGASLAEPGRTDLYGLVHRPPAIVASRLGSLTFSTDVDTDIGVMSIAAGYGLAAEVAFQIGVSDISDYKGDRDYKEWNKRPDPFHIDPPYFGL